MCGDLERRPKGLARNIPCIKPKFFYVASLRVISSCANYERLDVWNKITLGPPKGPPLGPHNFSKLLIYMDL